MSVYALKDEAFQRLKKRIKKFYEEHKQGEPIEYGGYTYTIDWCKLDEEKDDFHINFENPTVGYFEIRTALGKKGDLHLIRLFTRGHNLDDIKEAMKILDIPITEEPIICIKDRGVAYCPMEKSTTMPKEEKL